MVDACVTSWGVLVIWEEKVWIHLLSCKRHWGHWNKHNNSYIKPSPRHWCDLRASCLPALLHHLHPVHAGHRVLHWKYMEDLCFLNTTQHHLLGVSQAERQNWEMERREDYNNFMAPAIRNLKVWKMHVSIPHFCHQVSRRVQWSPSQYIHWMVNSKHAGN